MKKYKKKESDTEVLGYYLNFFKAHLPEVLQTTKFDIQGLPVKYPSTDASKEERREYFRLLNELAGRVSRENEVGTAGFEHSVLAYTTDPSKIKPVYEVHYRGQDYPIKLVDPKNVSIKVSEEKRFVLERILNSAMDLILIDKFYRESMNSRIWFKSKARFIGNAVIHLGQYAAFRILDHDAYVLVDPRSDVMGIRLLEIIKSLAKRWYTAEIKDLEKDERENIEDLLRGIDIRYAYHIRDEKAFRTGRLVSVDFDSPINKTIIEELGVTVHEFLTETRKLSIENPEQPTVYVKHGFKEPIPHAPEILRPVLHPKDWRAILGKRYSQALHGTLMLEPATRFSRSKFFVSRVNHGLDFLKIDTTPISPSKYESARPIDLQFTNGTAHDLFEAFSKGLKAYRSPKSSNVLVVKEEESDDIESFLAELKRKGEEFGIKLNYAQKRGFKGTDADGVEGTLKDAASYDLVLLFLGEKWKRRRRRNPYVFSKRFLNELGVTSQVVNLETVDATISNMRKGEELKKSKDLQARKKGISLFLSAEGTLGMLVSQIVAKLGGVPWRFKVPVTEEKSLFVGIDVFHDGGAIVPAAASVFDEMGEFVGGVSLPLERVQGEIVDADRLVRLALGKCGGLGSVERVLVYYDGFPRDSEVEAVEKVLTKEYAFKDWRLFSVPKSSRVRVFKSIRRDGEEYVTNPDVGLIVYGDPIHANEFLIVTTEPFGELGAELGTARPLNVRYLRPEQSLGGKTLLELANITYALTRHYWIGHGPVRSPVPLYYADMANSSSRQIGRPLNERLLDRMGFA